MVSTEKAIEKSVKWTMPATPMAWFAFAARVLLGAIFVYASWDKIAQPTAFADAIANYQILPAAWINPAALLLPWIELICGASLISGVLTRGGAVIVTFLLVVFTAAVGYSAYRGLDIHCGCFTTGSDVPSNLYIDLLRDLVLLALAVMVLIYYGRSTSKPEKA